MMGISALVVNVLCELSQIIGRVRKNYVLSKRFNKTIQTSLKHLRLLKAVIESSH
jgi:hypothetical protein